MTERDKKRLTKLAAQVKSLRNKRGLSHRQLASLCDVGYAKISRIETAKANMTVTTLIELAEGLGVKPKDLLDIDFD